MRLTHPDSSHSVEVSSPNGAEAYLSQGWTKAKATAKTAAKKTAAKKSAASESDSAPSE